MDVSDALSKCRLCPRCCGVNRLAGELGRCGSGSVAQVFRYGAHFGEEPAISGSKGSGAVFFSRCTMSCVYCQNYPWSQQGRGKSCGVEEMADILKALRDAGCHNWNMVSPTPWLPLIKEAFEKTGADCVRLPVVYNTSGFERVETLEEMEGLIDVYLTDLRYSRDRSALEGSGVAEYVGTARTALKEMWRQTGSLKLDESGIALSGTICRLLILPGRADEVVENLEWLADEIGTGVSISVMSQYLPAHKAVERKPWNRGIEQGEYAMVCDAVERFGFSNGWIQDFGGVAPKELVGFEMHAC